MSVTKIVLYILKIIFIVYVWIFKITGYNDFINMKGITFFVVLNIVQNLIMLLS